MSKDNAIGALFFLILVGGGLSALLLPIGREYYCDYILRRRGIRDLMPEIGVSKRQCVEYVNLNNAKLALMKGSCVDDFPARQSQWGVGRCEPSYVASCKIAVSENHPHEPMRGQMYTVRHYPYPYDTRKSKKTTPEETERQEKAAYEEEVGIVTAFVQRYCKTSPVMTAEFSIP